MALDVRSRFDTFVVGAANRLAVSAARAVAQSPGAAYNPLFIYAASGLGKTHLLSAIGQLAKQLQPDLQVEYVTTDELVEHLHQAVTRGETETFRQRFAELDILLLDDVQFLTGRQETQSELLRLFNVLQRSGKQIVLTSDRPPAEIADLDDRLMTRFSGGLLVDMGAPDYETRVAILRRRCDERDVTFPPGVVEEVARVVFANVREMHGAINRLIAFQTLGEGDVTVESIQGLLGDRGNGSGPQRLAPKSGEYESFLSGLAVAVAQHVDARRVKLVESTAEWRTQGYRTAALERALQSADTADPDALLKEFEHKVARLRALEQEIVALDPTQRGSVHFRDPEAIEELERLADTLRAESAPPPPPDSSLVRAEFEVGPSNQLAVHAADAIVEEPGRRYNPLVIHGGPGVGKTHLLHAIGNELAAASGGAMTIACVNASDFVNELIAALQDSAIETWRGRYRRVDALLIDQIEMFAGTERTQDEFFHLFNALMETGKQVVLTSSRAPRTLTEMDERLRSRFEGGLVVELQPPDRLLREKLIARALAAAGVEPTPDVLHAAAGLEMPTARDVLRVGERLAEMAANANGRLTSADVSRVTSVRRSTPVHRATPSGDTHFGDREKTVWDWPDLSGRIIEDLR
ncbi:MAG TPA: DnaA/Hda family protein [Gemmatimonadaceae bacterium]|nr:DnaA/Hda family protein [Gemmatimonadaceae bacterium]